MSLGAEGPEARRSAEFTGRQPPSDEETIWIDADYLFDLMKAICDLLYEDGCYGSSFLTERAIDLFLYEIGRTTSPKQGSEHNEEEIPDEVMSDLAKVRTTQDRSKPVRFQTVRKRSPASVPSSLKTSGAEPSGLHNSPKKFASAIHCKNRQMKDENHRSNCEPVEASIQEKDSRRTRTQPAKDLLMYQNTSYSVSISPVGFIDSTL